MADPAARGPWPEVRGDLKGVGLAKTEVPVSVVMVVWRLVSVPLEKSRCWDGPQRHLLALVGQVTFGRSISPRVVDVGLTGLTDPPDVSLWFHDDG